MASGIQSNPNANNTAFIHAYQLPGNMSFNVGNNARFLLILSSSAVDSNGMYMCTSSSAGLTRVIPVKEAPNFTLTTGTSVLSVSSSEAAIAVLIIEYTSTSRVAVA